MSRKRRKRSETGIVSVRLTEKQFHALDEWSLNQPVPPTVAMCVRVAVDEFLEKVKP